LLLFGRARVSLSLVVAVHKLKRQDKLKNGATYRY